MRIGDREFEVSTEPYQGGWRSYAFLPGGKQRASATCDSREGAEMDLARQLKAEFAPTPKFDPTMRYENAGQMVDVLLEQPEGMGRRGFLGRLMGLIGAVAGMGNGPAGAAAAPVAAARGLAQAAPAAAGAANMRGLATLIRQIEARFIDERVGGFTHPGTGVFMAGVTPAEAASRWAEQAPRFADSIMRYVASDPNFVRRLGLQAEVPEAQEYVRQHPEPPPEARPRQQPAQPERPAPAAPARPVEPQAAAPQRRGVQVWPERQPRDQDEEAPWDMESQADKIVKALLEDEQQDQHVKAYDRVQKWDKAHGTYQKLYGQHLKARSLFRELGKSIGYERALAQVGLGREDVAQHIHGDQIGATHNYKGTRTAKVCQDKQYCSAGRVSTKQTGEKCADCGGPLAEVQVRYAPNELRGKFGRYMFGVETNDGRRVWFPEPIPPEPQAASDEQPEGKAAPVSKEELERQKRLGKWW